MTMLVSSLYGVLIWLLFSVQRLLLTCHHKPQDWCLEGKVPLLKPSRLLLWCKRNDFVSDSSPEVREHRCDSGVTAAFNSEGFVLYCSKIHTLAHTHLCTSIFGRMFIGIMYLPAPYPTIPYLTITLTRTVTLTLTLVLTLKQALNVVITSQNVLTSQKCSHLND